MTESIIWVALWIVGICAVCGITIGAAKLINQAVTWHRHIRWTQVADLQEREEKKQTKVHIIRL